MGHPFRIAKLANITAIRMVGILNVIMTGTQNCTGLFKSDFSASTTASQTPTLKSATGGFLIFAAFMESPAYCLDPGFGRPLQERLKQISQSHLATCWHSKTF